MAWYAEYFEADGKLYGLFTSYDPDRLPAGVVVKSIDHFPDPDTERWEPAIREFVPRLKTKAELEPGLLQPYEVWQMWKTTLAEATSRGLAAGVLTALQTKTDSAWSAYAAAINAWRNA